MPHECVPLHAHSDDAQQVPCQVSELPSRSPLQAILDFCAQPGFCHEVYLNLDCRIERSNLFEGVCALLSKTAFPVNSALSAVHLLSLDGVFSILSSLAARSGLLPVALFPHGKRPI